MQVTIDSDLLEKVLIKMVKEFGKSSENALFRVIIKKYIKGDFSLRTDDVQERYQYKPEEKQRKNIYVDNEVRDNFDKKIKNEVGVTNRKRTAAIEVCLMRWLDGYFDISKQEFSEEYNN